MALPGRRNLKGELKTLVKDEARVACHSGRQGRRESEEVPKDSGQGIDNHGEDTPDPGFLGTEMGNESQNMLERLKGDMKKDRRTRRKRFVTETNAALKVINQKTGNAAKEWQEQRQKLYRDYNQQFLTLFWEWNRDVQKSKEEEEKLLILFYEQQTLSRQARTAQSQRLKRIKNLCGRLLKDVAYLEENQKHLGTNGAKEFRRETANLQGKITVDVVTEPIPTKIRLREKIYSSALHKLLTTA